MTARDPAIEEWRAIARGPDVLYDVLSWPDKRNAWTDEEFYASGESDWQDFERHWKHYEPDLSGRCVEIGCGVGRVTAPLARTFEHVTAIDVSNDMIERARKRVDRETVEFHQVSGPLIPQDRDATDALFSVHVMQHLESMDVLATYIREMARVLRPGGTLMVHIPLRAAPPPSSLERIRAELKLRASRRALRHGQLHSTMRTRSYWLNDVWLTFDRSGFADVELRLIPVRSNGYGHQFWFARAR